MSRTADEPDAPSCAARRKTTLNTGASVPESSKNGFHHAVQAVATMHNFAMAR
jgi:hypothetical protein